MGSSSFMSLFNSIYRNNLDLISIGQQVNILYP
jgi:hypothetical protein